MKKFLFSFLIVLLTSACTYPTDSLLSDRVSNLESRISQLEVRLNTELTSIQSLVSALQQKDYVTEVVPIMQNEKAIGYIISFAKSEAIVIYHGKDGNDAESPQIGIKEENGVFYWTVNGEWLLDKSFNKIPVYGKDGLNGADGKDGKDGKDGITPQLKIENEYWYISYDNGGSWEQLGKAMSGSDKESSGDSFFSGIDITDEEYVIFTLVDGTEIKLPTWYSYEKLQKQCKAINNNIASLQASLQALEENDYIVSCTPLLEDGIQIGYTITFAKSGTVVIYHGEDGKDGKDGKDGEDGMDGADGQDGTDGEKGEDGESPIIGVREDNGTMYWTLNGEWLLDESKNKIPVQGNDGKDGADGKNGADGVTPQLKIENQYWYVSYDNGLSWEQLGRVADGNNPESSGDSLFSAIDTTDGNFVVFTLIDGTQIKLPTWSSFEQLQKQCNQMNNNITSLQSVVKAMEQNDYIISCTPLLEDGIQIGYTITFAKSGSIVIYHGKDGKDGVNGTDGADGNNGDDGEIPVIGIKEENGIIYWTLNGEWLLDESQNKIPVQGKDGTNGQDGVTPLLKIENGYWYISYDNGVSWEQLGKATGEQGDTFFESVTQDEDNVYLELEGGEVITISKSNKISVEFDTGEIDEPLVPGLTYNISYVIETGSTAVSVEVIPSGNISVENIPNENSPLKGVIKITAGPTLDAESKIVVFVSNGTNVLVKSLEFEAAGLKVYDNAIIEVSKDGGEVKLEFLSNIDCVPVISASDQDWISVIPETKSPLEYGCVSLSIGANPKTTSRSAKVRVESSEGSFGVEYIIRQAGGQPNNELWYTTTDEAKISKDLTSYLEKFKMLGHNYSNGKGVIKCESDISYISNSIFENCGTISSISLPETVTSIGDRAFYSCSRLREIKIADKVSSIGKNAFQNCTALTEINLPDGIRTLGINAFSGCSSLVNIEIPESVTKIEDNLFSGCSSLLSVDFKGEIISIEKCAFMNCIALRDITFPNTLTSIGAEAFYGCDGLTDVTLPESVKTIYKLAFGRCRILRNLNLGSGLTAIWDFAFEDCDGLTNLIIPDNVVSIGNGAFHYCDGLRVVNFGKNIARIGSGAFYKCDNLHTVYIEAITAPVLYDGYYEMGGEYNNGYYPMNVFYSKPTIYVPYSSTSEYLSVWSDYDDCIEGYEFE